jgi:hypothetical protein
MEHSTDNEVKQMFQDLLREADALGLTPWEQGFLDSVSRYRDFSRLTPKQKNVLIKIFDKYFKDGMK